MSSQRRRSRRKGAGVVTTGADEGAAWWQQPWFWGFLLFLAVVVAYQKTWHAGFIWDDDQHVTQNPCIVGPLGFKEIWTTHAARICPLVISTFWLEHHVWALHPLPYHLFNIAMHTAGALVLWRLLIRLGVTGAWFGAALWALHPVQVETVAWVTELKNTQSCFFYLLAILAFVRWRQVVCGPPSNPSKRDYLLAILFGALAMASKSSTVVLPVVLGLVLWWIDRRLRWRNLLSLAPFFVMSFMASGWSMWSQRLEGAKDVEFVLSLPERVAIAGKAVWFYLSKLLWPYPLTFIYSRWEIDISSPLTFFSSAALLTVLLLLWFQRQGRLRAVFFGLAYFVIALLPVLALVDHYFLRYSFVGDHFQYLASIGPMALLGAGATIAVRSLPGGRTILAPALSSGLLLLLVFLSWKQCEMYKDNEVLWETTIRQNPKALMAYNNLGTLRLGKNQVDEAIVLFQKAIEMKPDFALAHYNLGQALIEKKQLDQAIEHYEKALAFAPAGVVRAMVHTNFAGALVLKGQLDQAISHYESAAALESTAEIQTNLGYVLFLQGKVDEAMVCYENALKIDSGYPEAHFNLGLALQKQERLEASISQYQKALDLRPTYAEAANNLAWLLATSRQDSVRNGERAVTLAQRISQSNGGHNAAILDTLAAAYAEAGRFEDAVATAEKAIAEAQAEWNPGLVADLKDKLNLYRVNTPFRDR